MGRAVRLLALAVMVAFVAGCGRESAGTRSRTGAERWLKRTEAAPGRADLVTQLRQDSQAAEIVFIEAFNNGPPEAEREALADTVDWHWAMMQLQIAEPGVCRLEQHRDRGHEVHLAVRRQERGVAELGSNYKAAALTGLAITQGQAGKHRLERVAANPNSPHRSVAIAALRERR